MKKPSAKPYWFREGCDCFGCTLISKSFGSERRKLIMNFLSDKDDGWRINKKYTPQFKKDPDLQKLVKQGKIRLVSNKIHKVKK